MRVLHLCSRYWPGVGGGENYMREVSERLAAEGHTVTVATTDADEAELLWNPTKRRIAQRDEIHNGVHIRRFPLHHIPLAPLSYSVWRYIVFPQLAMVLPIPWLKALCRFTPWSPELWRWAETTTETFDLVGAIGILYEPFVAVAHRVARRQRIPFVVYPLTHLGAGPAPARDEVSRYYTMRHQVALVCAADRVMVMTPTEGAFYEQRGLPPERLALAPPGIQPVNIPEDAVRLLGSQHQLSKPIIVFLSAMAYDKGAMTLVNAMRRLWAQGHSVELVMAGKELEAFRRFRQSLPAVERDRVKVLGSVSEADKHALLAMADVVAMPSRTDSFGIIYLEAWWHGKPVIGAQAWGMDDVIRDGEDGLLVPFGDVPALANAIATLLDQPERRLLMGANGAAKVRAAYTWDTRYAKIRDQYTQLTLPVCSGFQP
jgi:glycogen(starch) synthase